ncbi:zinc ribbon domain-containing protein [Candidatus Methylacidithermus pantelleriae]|uniref:Cas12f1-like TNB domain-containing protein n=1 Tax=Candidatus Methylacidithermus pantelleriae TaxID=2744239 RepID=A0A8J2BTV4_9BACT|nr:hypothetical protein MPNT_330017 [Candidatus Methylacidithermus pantelleriae]
MRPLAPQGWRQLQSFVEYKASTAGIEVEYVDRTYTSQSCLRYEGLGRRSAHGFECPLSAHSEVNSSRNFGTIGEAAHWPRAAVETPDVESMGRERSAISCALQEGVRLPSRVVYGGASHEGCQKEK